MGESSRRTSESSRKRKRRRGRSPSRSRSRSTSAPRKSSTHDDDRKSLRHRHSHRRSCSRSSDLSDHHRHSRSRSRSRSERRGGSGGRERERSSRGDARESSKKKERRRHRSRSRDHRSRSRSPSRHRSSSKKDKEKKRSSAKHRSHRYSRSKSRSPAAEESPKRRASDADVVESAASTAIAPRDEPNVLQTSEASATEATAVAVAAQAHATADNRAKPSISEQSIKLPEKADSKRSRRSRSRENNGKRHRSRSRSRGRDKKPQSAEVSERSSGAAKSSSTSSTSTAEAAKKFKFGGIAIKTDKLKGGLKAPLRKSPLNAGKPLSQGLSGNTDEKKKRQEKLKLWREQQLKLKQEEAQKFLAEEDAVPKQLTLWSMDEEEKQETPEERQRREELEEQQRQRVQKVVEEVDPLDAYMAGLVDEAAIQQSIANPASNVISLDEIESKPKINIYGTFLPQINAEAATPIDEEDEDNAPATGGTNDVNETPEEREAREERELKEFMRAIKEQREKEASDAGTGAEADGGVSKLDEDSAKKDDTGRIYQGFEEDVIGEGAGNVDHRSALEILQEAQKKKEIKAVDHSQIEYIPFQKKFYVVPKEIKDMSEAEVEAIRNEHEIKIRGKNCPRPVKKWTQCGFSVRMLQLIKKHGYTEPFAIQRQALPAIMSGRDVIGIAKTGSGKTLAFLLPMYRHILHQPPLQEGEGPIGLIMAPARELAQQIYLEAKKFAKGLGMRATAVYGGSSVSEQIGNLKRGSDIVICTPGRMIDILTMSAGKMVSLKRVTYVVLDEADRMFDMGFEPQITKIMLNIREDRQTLLFSATFPRAVETLARRVLKKPIEITVGGRSTASGDITQYVEVRDENDKFMRLLQLLGLWYEKGNVLVFVNTQQACDQVFQDLMKAGYPALSLHGGKDQVDRDYTIDDFKRKVRTLMVATSVAGRGLDVKDLVLVINYHCPNHLEDYVHRVGRTGRAGRKGTAYTFISPDEEEYSVDLVKALEAAKQVVPPELSQLAEGFKDKVKRGEARYHGSGFKGKGYTFDETERNEAQRAMDLQKRQYEIDQGIFVEQDAGEEDDTEDAAKDSNTAEGGVSAAGSAGAAAAGPKLPIDSEALSAVKKAQQIAQILDLQYKQTQANAAAGASDNHFEEELEINDYPQQARWKVTQKEASDQVAELTGAAVIARGSYVPAGRKPNPGERKLYLAIEGPTRASVIDARRELQRILDETTLQVGLGGDKYGKYNL